MRPLPRIHALTDGAVAARPDLGVCAAAIAAAGPAVALHARDRAATAAALTALARRFVALARPAGAAVLVNARPDVAAAAGAHGVQLGADDLAPADARAVLAHDPARGAHWVGRSVHDADEARAARDAGADFVVAGHVWATRSHPGVPGRGLAFVEACAAAGLPVVAVGGVTPERAAAARDAGAYGVAAIGALWGAADPHRAALALLAPWAGAA